MNAREEYMDILTGLINATDAGKLTWKRQNPTTLYLERRTASGELAVISLQKVQNRTRDRQTGRIRAIETYVFTVKNVSNKEFIIQIDSNEDGDFQDILGNLFNLSNYRIEKSNIDFLRGIFDDL